MWGNEFLNQVFDTGNILDGHVVSFKGCKDLTMHCKMTAKDKGNCKKKTQKELRKQNEKMKPFLFLVLV